MNKPTIMLTAGGTGGHLFPAVALTQELMRRGYIVDLMTDSRGDKFQQQFPGRQVYFVDSSTISGRGVMSALNVISRIKHGMSEAKAILSDIRPGVVMGFGGYPTVPPILSAKRLGLKAAVHEANAVMGRANRMLSPLVDAIATSFDQTKHATGGLFGSKVYVTGNPVRDAISAWRDRPYSPPVTGHNFILSIFGGSQGARIFSDIVPEALKCLEPRIRERLILTQQCRPEDIDRVSNFYREAGIEAELAPFFDNLPDRLASSHLIIARAGASTVTELTVIGRPSILVPLPHSIDNDQLLNASRLTDVGGAWLFEQNNLTPETLATKLSELYDNPNQLAQAAAASHGVGKPEAVNQLADLVEQLARP